MAFLKPLTVFAHTTLSSKWFQSMTVFGKKEFRYSSECHCIGLKHLLFINVIFSWPQIGRSTIFGGETGAPDREIFFCGKKKVDFSVKNCDLQH